MPNQPSPQLDLGTAFIRSFSVLATTFGLLLAAFALAAAIQLVLPGVIPNPEVTALIRPLLVFAIVTFSFGVALAVAEWLPKRGHSSLWKVAGTTYTMLGLTGTSPKQWAERIWYGIVACAGQIVTTTAVWQFQLPGLPGPDARLTAVQQAPVWAGFVHGMLTAPLVEELIYRAPLLLLGAALSHLIPRRILLLIMAPLVILWAGVMFGYGHLDVGGWHNVVSAGLGGLVLAAVMFKTRSVVPCIIGHGLYNGAANYLAITAAS